MKNNCNLRFICVLSLIVASFLFLSIPVSWSKDYKQKELNKTNNKVRVLAVGIPEPAFLSVIFTDNNIQCKDNDGNSLSPPHWKRKTTEEETGDTIHQCAVIKSQIMGATLTFDLAKPGPDFQGTVTVINIKYYKPDGGFTSLGFTQPNPNTISIPAGGAGTVQITIGPFPSYVHPGMQLEILCQLNESPASAAPRSPREPLVVAKPVVYTVYDTPTRSQLEPWIGVLDNACNWAYQKYTPDSVSEFITKKLNQSPLFYYTFDAHWIQMGKF